MSKRDYDRQCPSCGGICRKSGCERKNIDPDTLPEKVIKRLKAELAEAKKVPEGMSLVRLTDIVDAKHYLEKATEWNGQGWNYNLLHPMFYRPAIELLDEMMADAMLAARSAEK